MVVPLGFEPRSEEPESSMMDRYTKGLCPPLEHLVLEISG